jgi:hypothetical protein
VRRLLFVVALGLLAVSFLNVARGVHHHRDYRDWALHNGSYSDVVALSGDRYLHGDHPVPYLDDRIEYPVVLGFVIWLPSYAPGGHMGYVAATALLLALALVWTVRSLARIPGADPWLFAATPAIALYGVLNWDLIGIALMVAAVAAVERERTSGVWLGLGIATKLFPVAVVPAFLRIVRRPVVWLATVAAVVLVINVPLAAAAFDNWSWFFRFSSKRPPDFAIWNVLRITSPQVINAVSLAALGAAALIARRGAATRAGARLGLALVITVGMATHKVSSPQYALWVFAVAALVAAPWRVWAVLVVGSTFDFIVELWRYPHHALALTPTPTVMVLVRTAGLAVFVAWCVRRLRVEIALDEGAEGGGGVAGDRAGLADRLDFAGG